MHCANVSYIDLWQLLKVSSKRSHEWVHVGACGGGAHGTILMKEHTIYNDLE
jgi:hypothetical protein